MADLREERANMSFGNPLPASVQRAARRLREQTDAAPAPEGPVLGAFPGLAAPETEGCDAEKGLVIAAATGGMDALRNAAALASCAQALGYQPCWLDLGNAGEPEDRGLAGNAMDWQRAGGLAPQFAGIPTDAPVLAVDALAAQAALCAGMEHVVNAMPDARPGAMHLAEGSLHTVQTHVGYHACRILEDMGGAIRVTSPMPEHSLACTGHYVPADLMTNLTADCAARTDRKLRGLPPRLLLAVENSKRGIEQAAEAVLALRPELQRGKAQLALELGAAPENWDAICEKVRGLKGVGTTCFPEEGKEFAYTLPEGPVCAYAHRSAAESAVAANALLRWADVLITAPNALAFYPLPKLLLAAADDNRRRNAFHAVELGDSTPACDNDEIFRRRLDLFLHEDTVIMDMLENIVKTQINGIYEGGYWTVRLAMGMKQV